MVCDVCGPGEAWQCAGTPDIPLCSPSALGHHWLAATLRPWVLTASAGAGRGAEAGQWHCCHHPAWQPCCSLGDCATVLFAPHCSWAGRGVARAGRAQLAPSPGISVFQRSEQQQDQLPEQLLLHQHEPAHHPVSAVLWRATPGCSPAELWGAVPRGPQRSRGAGHGKISPFCLGEAVI